VIFQLIQQYVRKKKEYLMLMSCRKKVFSSVKFETVNYSLLINDTAEEVLRRVLNSVKDKSKQISVTFFDMGQSEIKKFVELCDCIADLSVDGRSQRKSIVAFDSFPFKVFNNILHLTLIGVSGMRDVNLYLEKTAKLVLESCLDLGEITAWNAKNVLQELVIRDCSSLKILPPLENISEVSIFSTNRQSTDFLVGRQKEFFSQGVNFSLQTLQTMSTDASFLSSVEELQLKMWFSLPAGFTDFSWCQNISVLDLSLNSFLSSFPPRFSSVFHGKQLKLNVSNYRIGLTDCASPIWKAVMWKLPLV
jgi:hypothetical protein